MRIALNTKFMVDLMISWSACFLNLTVPPSAFKKTFMPTYIFNANIEYKIHG